MHFQQISKVQFIRFNPNTEQTKYLHTKISIQTSTYHINSIANLTIISDIRDIINSGHNVRLKKKKNVLQASLLQKCLRRESKYTFLAATLVILLIELQTLVYDILPSTTAVFSYAIGSRKLSANEQFFLFGAQTLVSLLQTTQIISHVCFITDHVAYASSNKTKIV